MSDQVDSEDHSNGVEFAKQAEEASTGFLRELFDFLRHNKKWWLLPVVLALLLLGVMIIIAGSVAAPFIYPLF